MSKRNSLSVLIKLFSFIVVIVGALFYSAQDRAVIAQQFNSNDSLVSNSSSATQRLIVKRVIDGDTILLSDGRTIRYLGIDTPETHSKVNGHFENTVTPYGLEAYVYNRKLIEGKEVRLEYDTQRIDKYGRTLAYCYVGDIFVNARMLEHGYACVFMIPPNVKYADNFIRLQRIARNERRGLWGMVGTIGPREAASCANQIRAVRGKVAHAYSTKTMVYLNLGNDPIESFTVAIYRKDLVGFRKKNINPESYYMDKIIEVAGRIRDKPRTQIIVSGPEQIDVIDS
jgi:micrococcal nuclease